MSQKKAILLFEESQEEEVQLTKVVPFLVGNELLRLGAIFEKKAGWQPFAITDGRLITGQNPASSTSAAKAIVVHHYGGPEVLEFEVFKPRL